MQAFSGTWKLVDMEHWEAQDIHGSGQGIIEFSDSDNKKGYGKLAFSNINAGLDCRYKTVHKRPYVDFSISGDHGGQILAGRGYAILRSDSMMEGTLIIHNGIESWFVAQKIGMIED